MYPWGFPLDFKPLQLEYNNTSYLKSLAAVSAELLCGAYKYGYANSTSLNSDSILLIKISKSLKFNLSHIQQNLLKKTQT